MSARGRIDRRISVASHPAVHAAPLHRIVFRNGWGSVAQVFEPADLDMPADIAAPLIAAFRIHDAGASPRTRQSRWRALRKLAAFVRVDGVSCATDVNAGTIQRYLASIAAPKNGKQLGRGTMSLRFALVRPLLERAERIDPALFGSALAIPWNPFPRLGQYPEPKERLSAPALKAILAACYEEIDAAWATFQHGQAIIAMPEMPSGTARAERLERWVWRLHRLGGGIAPSGTQMRKNGFCSGTLRRYGCQGGIAQHYHLTSNTMTPFYIALAIQLAANPEPLRIIRRDCLVPHPIDDDRVMVEWLKHKTGRKPKLQRRSFDRRRPRAAPQLIEMLLAMTAPLVDHALADEQHSLFLVRHTTGTRHRRHDRPAGLIASDTIFEMIARFVRRSNARIEHWNAEHPGRARLLLPMFSPGQLRGSVATQHYIASGGDLAAASAILNHASLVTTDTYIEGPAVRRLERDTIARLQRLMVAWVSAPVAESVAEPVAHAPVTVLFGHRCLAPVAIAIGGTPRVCRHLGGCLVCPGLVVPLDAERYARVIQAHVHLVAARDRIDAQRWALFYAPSLRVLEQDLLPAFPKGLRRRANVLRAAMPALPDLE
jgi:hypothetical protein